MAISQKYLLKILKKQSRTMLKQAGPKYMPSLDKNAPNLKISELADVLQTLQCSQEIEKKINTLVEKISKKLNTLNPPKDLEKKAKAFTKDLPSILLKIDQAVSNRNFGDINESLKNKYARKIKQIEFLYHKCLEIEKKLGDKEDESIIYFSRRCAEIQDLVGELNVSVFVGNGKLLSSPYFLLLGEAGIGKTHTLCDLAINRLKENVPVVIMQGSHFKSAGDPILQVINFLKLRCKNKTLLNLISKLAINKKQRALIIIDALNESDQVFWKRNINLLINQLKPYPAIGLILSCRTPYEQTIIPKRPKPPLKHHWHPGFSEMLVEAQNIFFKYYSIPIPEIPILVNEFSNPLFLSILCKSLRDKVISGKHRQIQQISSGQRGMTFIFEQYVKSESKKIEKELGLKPSFTWNQLFKKEITPILISGKRNWFQIEQIKSNLDNRKLTKLINSLVAKGLLTKGLEYDNATGKYVEGFQFPYQKFSDHLIARELIKTITGDKRQIKKIINDTLGYLFKNPLNNSSIIEALLIEFPVRFPDYGELLDYIDKHLVEEYEESFIDGLVWREPSSFNDSTIKWINKFIKLGYKGKIFDSLVILASKPDHKFNHAAFDFNLSRMKMNVRDFLWSDFLWRLEPKDAICRLIKYINIYEYIPEKYSESYLCILKWTLTSNNRRLRDEATMAIYKIGKLYPSLLFSQAIISLKINDHYVSERMLASSYGVLMAIKNDKAKKKIINGYSKKLFNLIFSVDAQYSTIHVLKREYARQSIEIGLMLNDKLLNKSEKQLIKPPFKTGGIRKWHKADDKDKGSYSEGNAPIDTDFANYTIGRLIQDRENYAQTIEYKELLSKIRWRMYKLGYDYKLFGLIDQQIVRKKYRNQSEDSPGRIDRFGKKYSWIAYYEMEGLRQDKGLLDKNDYARLPTVDIDPSFPPEDAGTRLFNRNFISSSQSPVEWIKKAKAPNIKFTFDINDKEWTLLASHFIQNKKKEGKAIKFFVRAFLFNRDLLELKKGNRFKYPDYQKNMYMYAGEIPWADTYLDNEPIEVTLIGDNKIITRKKKVFFLEKEGKKTLIPFWNARLGIQAKGCKITEEEVEETIREPEMLSYSAIDPVTHFFWESYHSAVNPTQNVYVLSKELASDLKLTNCPIPFDCMDPSNNKAVLSIKSGDLFTNGENSLLIRKDLIHKYITDNKLEMYWFIMGERYCPYGSITEKVDPPYKQFYSIKPYRADQ